MAEAYVDQGAYASALGTTPTWGVPQEGDGTATSAATASAIASILFNAVPTTGAFSICGLSPSVTGVLSAASVDAAANTLATNINAVTTAVAAGVASGLPQLRNLVFARGPSGGAPAGMCQIMMRVGSTTLNHATNTNVAIAHTFNGTAPTLTQFIGGTGGCWGWFLNTAAIGVSASILIRTYGVFLNRPMVDGGFAFGEYDETIVRTGRNLSLAVTTSSFTIQTTRPQYTNLVFDDGTTWAGDAATDKLTVEWNTSGAGGLFALYGATQLLTAKSRRLGGLTFGITLAGSGTHRFGYDGSGTGWGSILERVSVIERSHAFTAANVSSGTSGSATRFEMAFLDCLLDFSAVPRTNLIASFLQFNVGSYTILGCDVRYTLTGVGGAAVSIPWGQLSAAGVHAVTMRGNTFNIGQADELTAVSLASFVPAAGSTYLLENNKGLGLPAGALGIMSSSVLPNTAVMVLDNLGIGGSAKYEDRRGYVEFNVGQPVLSATAPDGTVWSWLTYWTNASQVIAPGRPMLTPASRQQVRLTTGVRTWSMELLVDAVTLANLPTYAVVEIQYVNSAGDPVSELVPVTLAASSASWANTGAAPYNTWVARKISGTTAQSVKLDSVMSIRLAMLRSAPGGSAAAFTIDPEVALT